jgi:transcriptional regulator with XRE-family HTH domain
MLDEISSIMDTPPVDVHGRLAARLRRLRADRGLSLDALAERAGVSRSMISLVERGESSPTAAVLNRLAAGLGVTIAALFAEPARPDASPLARRGEQPSWRDPGSGYVRRNLSPPGYPSPIELVEVRLPAGARVAYDTPGSARAVGLHQQLWILEGRVELTVGDAAHQLEGGDCLAMRVDRPIVFHNRHDRDARYLVAVTADALPARAGADHGGSAP